MVGAVVFNPGAMMRPDLATADRLDGK